MNYIAEARRVEPSSKADAGAVVAGPSPSVVLVASDDLDALRQSLASLGPQCLAAGAELLVVRPDDSPGLDVLLRRFAPATIVIAPAGAGRRRMRVAGLAQATGDIVAFVEAPTVPGPRFVEGLRPHGSQRAGHEDGKPARPRLSVIVPAHGAQRTLGATIEALEASTLPRNLWELIVVDDSSPDQTTLVASAADALVRLGVGQPFGPAYARNRGAEIARGDVLVFVDADVCVHPGTLAAFHDALASNPSVSAVTGSYDTTPGDGSALSRYRGLVQHFTHLSRAGEVDTFWAACGAVRADAFMESGMFDEWRFTRPQLEDVELGHRLRANGRRILLRPDIQATHLKHWTLGGMVLSDLRDRGAPWTRVVHHEARAIDAQVHMASEGLALALTWCCVAGLVAAAWTPAGWWVALAALVVLMVRNARRLSFIAAHGGPLVAFLAMPLDFLGYVTDGIGRVCGLVQRELFGDPHPDATMQAYSEMGVRSWPPVPHRRSSY